MATNLLILTAQHLFNPTVLASPTAASGYGLNELWVGRRGEGYKINAAATTTSIDLDLGASYSPTLIHFVISGAQINRLQDTASTTAEVIASNSSLFTSPEQVTYAYDLDDLVGPRGEEITSSFVPSTAFRYWRLKLTTTASFKHEFLKWPFGQPFDMGRDPLHGRRIDRNIISANNREPISQVTFEWLGVTNAKTNEFIDKVVKDKDIAPVWLLTTDYHDVLFDYQVMHVWLKSALIEFTNWDSNRILCTFEECI